MPYLLEHEFMSMHHIDFIDIGSPNLIASGNTKPNVVDKHIGTRVRTVQSSSKLEDRQCIAFLTTRERIGD